MFGRAVAEKTRCRVPVARSGEEAISLAPKTVDLIVVDEWTSYVREVFSQSTIDSFPEVSSRPIKMMASKINLEMFPGASFGDSIEARLTVGKIGRVSFDMIVSFYRKNSGDLFCRTGYAVVFVDSLRNGFAPVPGEILAVIPDHHRRD